MAAKVEIDIYANDKTGGALGGIKSALGGILQTAAGFVAGQLFMKAGQAISDFAVGSISAASNLNETLSKTDAIFGTSSETMKKWALDAATNVGLSQGAALDAASSFALFGKSAGLAGQDLNDFATDNVGLAADMASFFNTSVEDAATAIQSAFRGETEPIRRYNVMLDDASLRAKALELGIVSTTKNALTPQQKVLAAQALIMEQTSTAQGDFEKTSAGMANQQRILAAQTENAQAQLGAIFLPVLTKVMTFVNTVAIPALFGFIEAFKEWPFLNDVILPFLDGIITALGNFSSFSLQGTPLGDFFNVISAWAATYGPGIMESFNAIWTSLVDGVMYIGQGIMDFFNNTMGLISIWLVDNGPLIDDFIVVLANVFTFLMDVLKVVWDFIQPLLEGIVGEIFNLVTIVMALITGDWAKAWEYAQKFVKDMIVKVAEALTALWDGILSLFGTSSEELGRQWNDFWEGVVDSVNDWADGIRNKISIFFNLGVDIIVGWINGMKSKATELWDYVLGIADKIKQTIADAFRLHSPSKVMFDMGGNIMKGLAQGIGDGLTFPIKAMANVAPAMTGALGMPALAGGMGGGTSITINVSAQNSMIDERWFATQFKPGIIQVLRDAGVQFRG